MGVIKDFSACKTLRINIKILKSVTKQQYAAVQIIQGKLPSICSIREAGLIIERLQSMKNIGSKNTRLIVQSEENQAKYCHNKY